jgi:hypothetical protein
VMVPLARLAAKLMVSGVESASACKRAERSVTVPQEARRCRRCC